MKSKKFNSKSPELLAPAGDFECLTAAINAGADAVYLGLEEFNMRARAKNFKISDFSEIKKICKSKKVKLYLTLNTIVYDSELKKIENPRCAVSALARGGSEQCRFGYEIEEESPYQCEKGLCDERY